MASQPVLIVGGLGQVGQALMATARSLHEHPDVVALSRDDVDLERPETIEAALEQHRPSAVFNCAVFHPVDLCETQPERAFSVNAIGVRHLAWACRSRGVRLVQVSTDYVFAGEQRVPYKEEARPCPLSVYAASKLAGEHLALAASPTHMVVRTSAVFGRPTAGHGSVCFIERMLERAHAGQPTRVVNDQFVSPTYAVDLAATLWELLACGGSGVYHVANRGACSWFDIARVVFDAAGKRPLLAPTTASEFGAPAQRPQYSALDNAQLRMLGLPDLRPWQEALRAFLRKHHAELATTV